jgi:hypothetical protein
MDIELAKDIPELYPDLIEQGGLARALQAAMRKAGSVLSVEEFDMLAPVFARVESGARLSQVHIGANARMFVFDFWNRGVCLAHGITPDIDETARAIDTWAASECSTGELASAFRFVEVSPAAAVYERGEEVEMQWQQYLASPAARFPGLRTFIVAAAAEPRLRQLFPFTSLNRFFFSRCTGYPFTRDTPHVIPLGGAKYEVMSCSGESLGRGDAADAVALVVAALPPDCGPAVPGTAEQLAGG